MAAPVVLTGTGNVTTASGGTAPAVVAKPANLVDGDLLLVSLHYQNNDATSTRAVTPPSGWTYLGPTLAPAPQRPGGLYVKPITNAAGEPSTYTFAHDAAGGSTQRWAITCSRVTGADLTDPTGSVGAFNTTPLSNTASLVLPTVTVGADELLVAYAWAVYSSSVATAFAPPSPMAQAAAASRLPGTGSSSTVWLGVESAAAGASGTRTIGLTNSVGSSGYLATLRGVATAVPITTLVIAHRGSTTTLGDRTEEQAGTLALLDPTVNGVEIDVRNPSDVATTGRVFLCHDTTVDRTSPNSSTGTVASMTSAQLDTAQIDDLAAYLAACEPLDLTLILVHLNPEYMTTQASVQPTVDILNASPLRGRVTVMVTQSNLATAAPALRAAGWGGRVGCFGLTAATWSADQPILTAQAVTLGFTPPGDDAYVTNRSHIATVAAAGLDTGASTVDTTSVPLAIDDGVTVLLTNVSDTLVSAYVYPPLIPYAWGSSIASTTAAAAGAGVRRSTAGSTAAATAAASGAGTKRTTGSSTTTATVSASGTGARSTSGGSSASATVAASGAGYRTTMSGSTATPIATTSGAGYGRRLSGASASLTTTPAGGGTKRILDGSPTGITATASGAGSVVSPGTGGSIAYGSAATSGSGYRTSSGGGPAPSATSPSGLGRKLAATGSTATTVATTQGAGLNPATGPAPLPAYGAVTITAPVGALTMTAPRGGATISSPHGEAAIT